MSKDNDSTNKLLDAALNYAKNGWHVFPCKPRSKMPLIGKAEGGNGCLDGTTDETQIRAWWTTCPTANIGLLCGEKSGVAVVDIDVGDKKNGWETLKRFPDLPETITQMTPTGGAHKIYRITGEPPKNRNGFPTKKDGIDIRSTNYYIMLSPSIHPDTKTEYVWADGQAPWEIAIADYPDFMRPEKRPPERRRMPWEQIADTAAKLDPVTRAAVRKVKGTPIIDRARLYLKECEPAVQGNAGHDSLLWAARALVVGFELDDATATSLLWEEFNPRCIPPWDMMDPRDVKDFERKVRQVQDTPSEKPRGWLLEELGLRTDNVAMQALGAEFAASLLEEDAQSPKASSPKTPLPLHCFPDKVRKFIEQVAKDQSVQPEGIALACLVSAGAAMGNAFRLQLNAKYICPPILWGMVVASSGSNKSGMFNDAIEPLRKQISATEIENPLLTPQGRTVLSDATVEAVVSRLGQNPRGLIILRDELAGWLKSYNAYKKGGGGDEQAWIEFHGGGPYQLDRKTNGEEIFIPAASVAVLGGIQPKVLAKCLSSEQFNSGLVPRMLVVNLPRMRRKWNDDESNVEIYDTWDKTLLTLRKYPFKELETGTGKYSPHILRLSPTAKSRCTDFFDETDAQALENGDAQESFFSKAHGNMGRIALILHGLTAATGGCALLSEVSIQTVENACELARWFLNEQLSVYGLVQEQHQEQRASEILDWARGKEGSFTASEYFQSHRGRYKDSGGSPRAKADLEELANTGKLKREGKRYTAIKEGTIGSVR